MKRKLNTTVPAKFGSRVDLNENEWKVLLSKG